MKLKSSLPTQLKYQAVIIESAAREAGLDFFEVAFELLPAQDVNGVASYGGFPVRYPSWRFGMEFERLQKGYRWGMSKIYELVINNDPTIAYLVAANSLLEQKLVMAHVYGHADFFKNNVWFSPTDRHMLDTMGSHATRVRRYIDAFGQERVEAFMDHALSIETLINPFQPLRERGQTEESRRRTPLSERARASLEAMTRPPHRGGPSVGEPVAAPPSTLPTFDVMGFLAEHAPLEAWEHDVLRMLRREAYYFAPQRMTKIMNEGWASFWHSRLLTGGILDPSEILDFADCHSSATATAPGQLNPYKLGIELFRYAEQSGRDIFQLRRVHNDVSLVDELVDEGFVVHSLPAEYVRKHGNATGDLDWRQRKKMLLQQLAWGGLPKIELIAQNTEGDGELVLRHHHDGRDLQLDAAAATLRHIARIWKGPVHLLTIEEAQGRRLVCVGEDVKALDSSDALGLCSSDPAKPEPGAKKIAS